MWGVSHDHRALGGELHLHDLGLDTAAQAQVTEGKKYPDETFSQLKMSALQRL